ncbi:MAG: putative fimbrial protein [Phycisphaerales bacterium]|nr:putative fimbrial protein [Phycisphaerales bacterium]
MKRSNLKNSGFSLIELVIVVVIIAIIAAIAVPKMSRGAAGANDAATLQNVSQMRSAIDMFTTEHGGTYPSATPATFIDQLTKYTDITGVSVSATKTGTCIYGPYLKSIPPLPVGANKGLMTITSTGPVGTGTFGWFYDTSTNSVFANTTASEVDAKGTLYSAY